MSTLTDLAEQLSSNTTTTTEAGRLAHEVTAGSKQMVGGVESHVVPSFGDVEREMASLTEYLQGHSYTDIRRWAGAFVMVHATLGLGDLLGAADLARRVSDTKDVPDGADVFVVSMIDAVLAHGSALPTAIVDRLMAARRAITQPADAADSDAAIDTIVSCFENEGWEFYLDRDARKLMIEFTFPLGQTRLVCDVADQDDLTIYALEVGEAARIDMPNAEVALSSDFPGVRLHVDEGRGTLTLFYTVPGASRLTVNEVRNAVVHVNGAAEHLIMMMR